MDGQCTCGEVRYRLEDHPLFVHCCHCTWCQRETGSAFAVNALIETANLTQLAGAPQMVMTPSLSGDGQLVARCPTCHVALWSHYPGAGPRFAFVRVGTLGDPAALPPDIHIFTASKQALGNAPSGRGRDAGILPTRGLLARNQPGASSARTGRLTRNA